jgi:hypothetical protein
MLASFSAIQESAKSQQRVKEYNTKSIPGFEVDGKKEVSGSSLLDTLLAGGRGARWHAALALFGGRGAIQATTAGVRELGVTDRLFAR